MNGNIVGEEFEPYVFSEIAFRQSIQGKQSRTDTDLNYLSNQSSWVKLASPVFIEEGGKARLNSILANQKDTDAYQGMELAKNAVLFNGLSSLQGKTYTQRAGIVKNNSRLWDAKAAYGLGGSDFGLQPMPGIIDAEVRCLNRGSIKKASINIRAYNKFQFEIIELLYLRLGYTMMLEFGNQKYLDKDGNLSEVGNTLIEELYFNKGSNGLTQLEILDEITRLRDKYNGNYDGFFGKVVNFDWTFNEDGSYSIRVDLITLGDVIESLQANPPIESYFPENLDSKSSLKTKLIEKNESLKDSPIINNASNDVLSAFMYTSLFDEDLWKKSRGGENDRYANYFNLSKESDQVAKDKRKNYPTKIPAKYSYYITFEELLIQVKKYLIPNVIAKNKKIEEQLSIDNSPSTYVNYFPNQISFDPRVCLIKPSLGGANIGKIKVPDIFEDLKNYVGIVEENVVVGQLMHVYLNYDFISQCLSTSKNDEKISIYTFLKKICDGINTALGGVNQIEVIIDESNNIIKFIDQTPIPGLAETKKRTDIVDLEVFGYNNVNQTSNFVKGINFNTNITPELASMITIGATAKGSNVKNEDATAFSKWNAGLTDRFNEEIIDPKIKIDPFNPEDDPKRWEEEATNIWENKSKPVMLKTTYRRNKAFKEVETTATVNNFSIGNNYQVDPTDKKEINEGEIGEGKRITKENYIIYYKTYVEKTLKEKNAIEEFKFQNELTKNYVFYLSDCFGGDIKYNVFTGKKEFQLKENNEITALDIVRLRIFNKPAIKETNVKTVGGSGKVKYLTFDPSFISRSNGIYKHYLNVFFHSKFNTVAENQLPSQPSPQIGFIPISFDINLQGISGVKIYNKLNINQKFLPPNYPQALKFLITKVDHTISDNNWSTNLGTLSIPNIDPDDYKQIWKDIGVDIKDLGSVLLPEDQRGPKAKGNKFTIEDHRAPKYRGNPTLGEEKTRIAQTGKVFSEMSLEKLISQFHPQFRNRFASFFTEMDEKYKGYTIKINSIQRDLETSQDLKKENPNNADPGYSRHNYNTAVDFNVITSDGKELKKSVNRNDWINHGFNKLAAKHNLDWGGNFDTYNDYVHFAATDYDVSKSITEFNSGKDVNSITLKT